MYNYSCAAPSEACNCDSSFGVADVDKGHQPFLPLIELLSAKVAVAQNRGRALVKQGAVESGNFG